MGRRTRAWVPDRKIRFDSSRYLSSSSTCISVISEVPRLLTGGRFALREGLRLREVNCDSQRHGPAKSIRLAASVALLLVMAACGRTSWLQTHSTPRYQR